MGNRAVIKFVGEKCGIYLHWNGGRDSVEAFLKYCELRGFRCGDYGIARIAQVIGNWFGGSLSIGIIDTAHKPERLDPGDNGVYYVKDWKIVRRYPKDVCEQHEYDLNEFLRDIDKAQPMKDRLGEEFLDSEEVDVSELKIGDEVWFDEYDGGWKKSRIIGFHSGWVNGDFKENAPYADRFGNAFPERNPNNYVRTAKCRRVKK